MAVLVHVFEFPHRIQECFSIRLQVFVDEQKVTREEEFDDFDAVSLHFLAEVDGNPAGTMRLRNSGEGIAKAERVAVLKEFRRQGVGEALMKTFEREAKSRGFTQVILGAQLSAMAFYGSLGYVAEGDEFLDARIRHRWMQKLL